MRDAAKALMTENEDVCAFRCAAVFAAVDLGVRAAQTDADDIDEDLAIGGRRVGHLAHGAGPRASRHDRERSHSRSIWALWPRY